MENFNENLTGAEEEVNIEKAVTTEFVETGTHDEMSLNKSAYKTSIPDEMKTIQAFMSRPYLIGNYIWAGTDAVGTSLTGDIDVSNYLDGLITTNYWEKIKGFNLCRGTAVIRVVLNAQPFHCGRLLLNAVPMCDDMGTVWNKMMRSDITQYTQQPCIELDCRDTAVELKMDYIAPVDWYNISTKKYRWSTYNLYVLGVLRPGTGGIQNAEVSVYLHFENMEFAAPAYPQMKSSGGMKGMKITSSEDLEMTRGTVSSGLRVLASVASSASAIPSVSSVTQPLSWAAEVAAGVASSLGYSKPEHDAIVQPQARMTLKHTGTSTGALSSYLLGVDSRNEIVRTEDVSLRKEDEMSFAYLKKVNSYFFTWNWAGTQVPGTTIGSALNIIPSSFYRTDSVAHNGHTATFNYYVPFGLLAKYFELWRGGIEITFKIPKTQFHTGRLQVTFTPGTGAYVSPGLSNSYFSLREIIDLSSGDEFTFRLPYLVEYNYLSSTQKSGTLEIKVLNALRGPDTVSSSIDILLFARAADDFELQAPAVNRVDTGVYDVPFYPQMRGSIVNNTIGNEPDSVLDTKHSELSIGESFQSIKQLLNRSGYVGGNLSLTSGFNIWPWFSEVWTINTTSGALIKPYLYGDPFQLFGPMYMMYRGSANVTISPTTLTSPVSGWETGVYAYLSTGINNTVAFATPFINDYGAVATSLGLPCGGVTMTEYAVGVYNFKVPYYCQTRTSLLIPQVGTSTAVARSVDASEPKTTLNVNWLGTRSVTLLRSLADDFQLSMFMGVPPILSGYV